MLHHGVGQRGACSGCEIANQNNTFIDNHEGHSMGQVSPQRVATPSKKGENGEPMGKIWRT